jgi:hypothetical protein
MPKGLRPITTYNVFGGTLAVTKKGTHTSTAFDLREVAQDGLFSLEYTITGSANIALTYTVCSTKGGTYFTPTGGGSIASGLTVGHGGLSFEPEMYPFIKFVATEADVATGTLVLLLNIQ